VMLPGVVPDISSSPNSASAFAWQALPMETVGRRSDLCSTLEREELELTYSTHLKKG